MYSKEKLRLKALWWKEECGKQKGLKDWVVLWFVYSRVSSQN